MKPDIAILDLEKALAAVKARSSEAADKERGYLDRIKQLEEANRHMAFQLATAGGGGGHGGDAASPGESIPIPLPLPRTIPMDHPGVSRTNGGASAGGGTAGAGRFSVSGGDGMGGEAAVEPSVLASRSGLYRTSSPAMSGGGEGSGSEHEPHELRRSFGRNSSYASMRTKSHHLTVVQLDGDADDADACLGSDGSDRSGHNNQNNQNSANGDGSGDGANGWNAEGRSAAAGGSGGGGVGGGQPALSTIDRVRIDTSLTSSKSGASGGSNDGLGGIQGRGGFQGNHHNSFSLESLHNSVDGLQNLETAATTSRHSTSHLDGNWRGGKVMLTGLGAEGKVPFQLLLCNDDGCEVQEPPGRAIRSRLHGVPHSQFSWRETPKNVLIIKKPNDKGTTAVLPQVVEILRQKGIKSWVEPAVHWETGLGATWQQDDDPHLDKIIDFIVCLGGDGTILWVSTLFPKAVPPVISFAMGSLGFLTAFEEDSIPKAIDDVVNGDFFFTQRSRLVAHVVRADGTEEHQRHIVLNEVVIDRGANSTLIDLDVNIDGNPMTKVLADGVMVSTPTGSTAYSLAAGGSMVHPGVSGLLFVPICPHTLSFRPLVLPDSVVLTIRVPETARVEPCASFDGKQQRLLKRGESLVVRAWRYPVPAICNQGESVDWFRAVKSSLLWNMRGSMQKPL